ncbi:Transcriptional regulator DegU, LuxR family [Lachnospiraceae bacterium TWA4]|nr:Transcriptional regulator DegU, LuxR family [Lachnospiraceae bacterium TWA4]
MIRVLIVDDERNIHKAYKADISLAPERYILVDTITNAMDAELICKIRQVDLILMDINTAQNESGIEATKKIKKLHPTIKIIITTSYMDPYALKRAKEAGADSFWFKDFSPIELLEVMERTVEGSNYWPKESPNVELGDTCWNDLTPTEKDVVYNLVKCISIKKTAQAMCIEETTVKYHLKNICSKVNCKNKTELLVLVIQSRLVLP